MLSPCGTARLTRASERFRPSFVPDFLLPAFAAAPTKRLFSSSSKWQSRVGSAPVSIPPDVDVRLLEPPAKRTLSRVEPPKTVEVEGPLGRISFAIPTYMDLDQNLDTRKATLSIPNRAERKHREMWGTTRAYLQNHVLGVSEGHNAILRLVGVGFRATIESTATTVQPAFSGQNFVSLKVGYSHPIELGLPQGVKASTPQPTRILLEGVDKEAVNQFAAEIRMWRKPEPYKGKGIFVNGETIKLKAKKIK
ncbi:hypothetical protein MMC13_007097 [Lambiella insularis]|nr:hypothetical protein [Lambiella insularis]